MGTVAEKRLRSKILECQDHPLHCILAGPISNYSSDSCCHCAAGLRRAFIPTVIRLHKFSVGEGAHSPFLCLTTTIMINMISIIIISTPFCTLALFGTSFSCTLSVYVCPSATEHNNFPMGMNKVPIHSFIQRSHTTTVLHQEKTPSSLFSKLRLIRKPELTQELTEEVIL